jgi:nucleotide-binding universal stress UspA family protein
MADVSRKLSNSFEGALAGGGDPATSPLYVFGPFLRLIVVAGVAGITFGASIWLVVLTVATVSAMYRLVMTWITDGSGGSGLTEEEFGGWAVKVNAGITFVEYTLTFLVSMAAMVTFIADRFPALNNAFLGIQYRTVVAIGLSIVTGWLVNRGPKVAARAFGPATAAVLVLLWAMIFATIWKLGLQLPNFDLRAFTPAYVGLTFGGYARILAVMTGIEIFANLVAAYDGDTEVKSRKAFGSLLIIMGSTSLTMIIVGPAILHLADPTIAEVSVFTQTMDQLLPSPLPWLGTLVGIVVLLSASAASAQGLQNLALGLTDRNYIPPLIGRRNQFGVADTPVWIEVAVVSTVFLAFGTHEETYLAIYAAGVFVLLSMTAWAASKRLRRQMNDSSSVGALAALAGTVVAALLTSGATVIIFAERFVEGAWTYFVFIPVLYTIFTYFRNTLGAPSPLRERLGQLEKAMWGIGSGSGQAIVGALEAIGVSVDGTIPSELAWDGREWAHQDIDIKHVLVPLDGSRFAEQSLPIALAICRRYGARLTLLSVVQIEEAEPVLSVQPLDQETMGQRIAVGRTKRGDYLDRVAAELGNGIQVNQIVGIGSVPETINTLTSELNIDLIVMSTRGYSGLQLWFIGSTANKVVQLVTRPVLLNRPTTADHVTEPEFKKLLVTLDGSETAEGVLPYARAMAHAFDSEILLLTVPEVPEGQVFGAMGDVVDELRVAAEERAADYLETVVAALTEDGLNARALVTGSMPARTIIDVAAAEDVDLLMLATHGRGGLDRLLVGSVAERVVRRSDNPVFLVPVRNKRGSE